MKSELLKKINLNPEGCYDYILPNFKNLSDKAIMVQAWKKSHEYIRKHNCFSDALELDLSCLNLEDKCKKWCSFFDKSLKESYTLDPMRIVLAPKPTSWELKDSEWKPVEPDDFNLRPLAHLSIKDQAIGTLFMICLANIVETEQGPVNEFDKDDLGNNSTVSYGNRLLCQWEGDFNSELIAHYQWANVETYEKYYIDFQNFVKRPECYIKTHSPNKKKKILIISTDLEKCYDKINRNELFKKVTNLLNKYECKDKHFLKELKRFFSWSWDKNDISLAKKYQKTLNDKSKKWIKGINGIPQGLVASGFFANIYLLDFDNAIKRNVKEKVNNFIILDYCRYVDDMKFILEVDENIDIAKVKEDFTKFINNLLTGLAKEQSINPDKTEAKEIEINKGFSVIEEQMQEIKARGSSPMDEMVGLEILNLTQHIWDKSKKNIKDKNELENRFLTNDLSNIKEETMERFAAYTWKRAYRNLASFLPPAHNENKHKNLWDIPCSRKKLDNLLKSFCQEAVFRWSCDSSKVRILRLALDLNPCPNLLKKVMELLKQGLNKDLSNDLFLNSTYILSEIYKSAATETGFVYDKDQLPEDSDIDEYRKILIDEAGNILKNNKNIPWYLENQIILFLVLMGSTSLKKSHINNASEKYKDLYDLYFYKKTRKKTTNNILDLLLLIYKFTNSIDIVIRHLPRLLKKEDNSTEIINKWLSIIPKDFKDIKSLIPTEVLSQSVGIIRYHKQTNKNFDDTKYYSFYQLINSKQNPFKNEVAILRLGEKLCEYIEQNKTTKENYLTPENIKIKCDNWNFLDNSSIRVTLEIKNRISKVKDLRYKPEVWDDDKGLGQIGRLLRAATVGNIDFTLMTNCSIYSEYERKEGNIKYWGFRSSYFKRLYGLFFDRITTGGPQVPFTPWINELFSWLLSFPGSFVHETFRSETLSINSLQTQLSKRLRYLEQYYGKSSDTSIFPIPIDIKGFIPKHNTQSKKSYDKLNVAIVQTIFPSIDIMGKDFLLEDKTNKLKHNQHLGDMLQMILKTFKIQNSIDDKILGINLIIFPELSIHNDQIHVLKQFADTMNCMVFCGLIFKDHPAESDKKINSGMWLIPQHKKDENSKREFITLLQGKKHLTKDEKKLKIEPFRPVQWIIQGTTTDEESKEKKIHWNLSASICFDATDIKLAADLRDYVDCYIISAFNKDIPTFDTMAQSLRYNMFNHTVIVNSGEFGGSTIQAPYKEPHKRIILDNHGAKQAIVTIKQLDFKPFKRKKGSRVTKSSPAGYEGRKYKLRNF